MTEEENFDITRLTPEELTHLVIDEQIAIYTNNLAVLRQEIIESQEQASKTEIALQALEKAKVSVQKHMPIEGWE